MSVLYLECGMGAAGDMLGAALYELLDDKNKKDYLDKMNSSGIPGVHIHAESDVKCGITGTHMHVYIHGTEEGDEHEHHHHDHEHEHHHHDHEHEHHHNHEHEHDHDHEHHHHHASLADVYEIINNTPFSDKVKKDACAVYNLVAEAESHAHGKEVSEIHFHEVGMMDAIADVLGVCELIERLGVSKILASPIRTGYGEVRCAHGVMPVPAPATAHLLRNIPVYAGNIRGEMCTPTGAALLKYFVNSFETMPVMCIQATGVGTGKKDFEQANCVRAFIGEIAGNLSAGEDELTDTVIELSCNIDDMSAEEIGFCIDLLRKNGALEVYATSAQMKKDRPGTIITALVKPEKEKEIVRLLFKHTTTWGCRRREIERYIMERHTYTRDTKFGPIRVKEGTGYGITRSKYEYDDVAKAAADNNISIEEVIRNI